MHYSQIFTGQTTRNFLEKKLSCILIHIHKPLCYEDMCFPQQKLVLHWLSLHKLNWTIQTLFLYKNPANMGPSQVICSRSTTKWITLKLQANFSGLVWSFSGGRRGIIWILIFMIPVFLPQWFMIATRIWSWSVSFCIVSLVFKPLFSSRVGIISHRYCITRYSFDQVCSFL